MEISKIFSTFYQGCTQKASSLAESTIGKIVGSVLKFSYRVINPFSAQSTLKHRSISALLFAGGAAAAVMYFKNKNKAEQPTKPLNLNSQPYCGDDENGSTPTATNQEQDLEPGK
jgi:hypothetical protein